MGNITPYQESSYLFVPCNSRNSLIFQRCSFDPTKSLHLSFSLDLLAPNSTDKERLSASRLVNSRNQIWTTSVLCSPLPNPIVFLQATSSSYSHPLLHFCLFKSYPGSKTTLQYSFICSSHQRSFSSYKFLQHLLIIQF